MMETGEGGGEGVLCQKSRPRGTTSPGTVHVADPGVGCGGPTLPFLLPHAGEEYPHASNTARDGAALVRS